MENHKVLGFMTSGILVLSDYCKRSGNLGPAKKDEKKEKRNKENIIFSEVNAWTDIEFSVLKKSNEKHLQNKSS